LALVPFGKVEAVGVKGLAVALKVEFVFDGEGDTVVVADVVDGTNDGAAAFGFHSAAAARNLVVPLVVDVEVDEADEVEDDDEDDAALAVAAGGDAALLVVVSFGVVDDMV
jgi:hypothetical protein